MITNSLDILKDAKEYKYAIAHFNINNLEWTRYILEECSELNSAVILGVSESAIKYMGGYKLVVDIIKDLISELNIKIPVVIHLDHASSFSSCKKAIDLGFTSVMIDASICNLDENIEITKEVVEYAHKKGVTVEAELGHVGVNKDKIDEVNVGDVLKFVKETNIDSLAPAIGNIHGIYEGNINLNFEKVKELSNLTIPLVLHGASGISDDDLKKLIEFGINKININTDLQIAWSKGVRKYLIEFSDVYDPRKIIKSGEDEMKKIIRHKLEIMGSIGRIQK